MIKESNTKNPYFNKLKLQLDKIYGTSKMIEFLYKEYQRVKSDKNRAKIVIAVAEDENFHNEAQKMLDDMDIMECQSIKRIEPLSEKNTMKKSELLRQIIKEEIQHIFEDAKDEMRINDIVKKAANDEVAMKKLAQTMANKITDGLKAVRRAEAAEKIIPQSEVGQIFRNRAKQLGLDVGGSAKNKDAPSGKGYIYLPTWSAIALWENEITGQLSDGAWENSKPYDHWKFWSDLEAQKGAPEVKGGGYARKTGYNLSSLIQYIGDRMLSIGRFGKAVGRKLQERERYGAEYLPEKQEDFPYGTQMRKGFENDYIKKLRKGDIDKFYKTQYTQTDLNNDLKYIKKAMETART